MTGKKTKVISEGVWGELLNQQVPLLLQAKTIRKEEKIGLVIVDIVNGFATTGAGSMAPRQPNHQIAQMVAEANDLAKLFCGQNRPILAFLDTHHPEQQEYPYPSHCVVGTGEEDLVPALKWLEQEKSVTLIRKDCINGFIGAYDHSGNNQLLGWVKQQQLQELLVIGICTDICVMDLVLTLLSARNHGMLGKVDKIWVYEKGCSTFDLPRAEVEEKKLPLHLCHPQQLTHHMGLYFMASRGAQLLGTVKMESLYNFG